MTLHAKIGNTSKEEHKFINNAQSTTKWRDLKKYIYKYYFNLLKQLYF